MRGGEEVLRIDLPNQVSFLNRAALYQILAQTWKGSHVLIDASETDDIDPDILSLIREIKETRGPARGVGVSLQGFRNKYELKNDLTFPVCEIHEHQGRLNSDQVLEILKTGHQGFRAGQQLKRDFGCRINTTAREQNPLAAVLSCIDSRVPVEHLFDVGIGEIFSVRVAGNIVGEHALGSLEYATVVAGVKLIVVMGHTCCGAVKSSLHLFRKNQIAPSVRRI